MIEIKHRYTDAVICKYDGEDKSICQVIEDAAKAGIDLSGANLDGATLDGANLDGATLDGATLDGATLDGANLYGANLYGANLSRANLDGANLSRANLYGANLYGANLYGANLYGANLYGANLDGANLDGANLDGANLDGVKKDLFEILSSARAEVPGLLSALRAGKVDGSTYSGDCACLVGTIANVRGCNINALAGITPNASRAAERWFLAIRQGVTPENNPIAKITEQWIQEFQFSNTAVAS